jgi:hypothetical protein
MLKFAGIFPKLMIIGKDSGIQMYSCLHLEKRQILHKAEFCLEKNLFQRALKLTTVSLRVPCTVP